MHVETDQHFFISFIASKENIPIMRFVSVCVWGGKHQSVHRLILPTQGETQDTHGASKISQLNNASHVYVLPLQCLSAIDTDINKEKKNSIYMNISGESCPSIDL